MGLCYHETDNYIVVNYIVHIEFIQKHNFLGSMCPKVT